MSNPASNLIKQVARRFGIAISRYPAPGTLGQDLSDFLSRMNIDVVLDIGAYAGTYARELREVGYRGRIISFEPVPASYERLHRAMHNDPLWSGEPFGLSDENRETLINTHNSGDFNSLLTLREEAQVAYSVDPSRSSQIPIQLRRLDAVLPKLI